MYFCHYIQASPQNGEDGACSSRQQRTQATVVESVTLKSVSSQRRLGSSITRGARKKTFRHLELPGLGELGIGQAQPTEGNFDPIFTPRED